MRRHTALAAIGLITMAAFLPSGGSATAQTVRFETTLGDFDLRLNPTGNPNLQRHVDNFLAYVGTGIYNGTVVNRAVDSFVLQLGGFEAQGLALRSVPDSGFRNVHRYIDVVVDADNDGNVDFNTSSLRNTAGTVSLALSAGNPNSGASSFFVNVGDNAGTLDPMDFIPFAVIDDLATVTRIMDAPKIDLSAEVGQDGSLAYIDVPLSSAEEFVLVERATVISQSSVSFVGPILTATGLADPGSRPLFVANSTSASPASAAPEPASIGLLTLAGGLAAARRRRRTR